MDRKKPIILAISLLALSSCGGIGGERSSSLDPASEPTSLTPSEGSQAVSEGESESAEVESSDTGVTEESESASSEQEAPSSEETPVEESSEGVSEEASIEESSEELPPEESSEQSIEESSEVPEEEEKSILYYEKVTSLSSIKDGDTVFLGNSSYSVIAEELALSNTKSGHLTSLNAEYSDLGPGLGKHAMHFTLRQDGEYFQFFHEGLPLGTGKGKLTFDNPTEINWSISFSAEGRPIIDSANSSYGRLYYHSNNHYFTTYTNRGTYCKDVEIYRAIIGKATYPETIELSGNASMEVGETQALTLNYLPEETNIRMASFYTSDSDILSVDNNGNVTALALGEATIYAHATSDREDGFISTSFDISVLPTPVQGISFKETTLNLYVGQGATLTPDFLPNNATNKSLLWSSSNEEVASVDDGAVTAIAAGEAIITATSVDGGYSATCTVTVSEEQLDKWTIMLYVCGSNLESESNYGQVAGLATTDISEILSVSGQPEDVNIIIQTGGANKWSSKYGISSKKLERYHVENKKLVKDDSLTNASMGDESTFTSFLNWGLSSYPAEKTGVILWDHGGGMSGCCQDENFGYDILSPKEIDNSINSAFSSNNIQGKLDFIGYDCCLMQVADLAEMHSHHFDYMIASQESEAGEGWDYRGWLKELYQGKPTEEFLATACDDFVSYFTDTYGSQYDNDQTLSLIDLSKMEAVKEAIEGYAAEKSSTIKANKTAFKSLVKKVTSYGSVYFGSYSELTSYCWEYGISASDAYSEGSGSDTYYVLPGYLDFGTVEPMDFFDLLASNTKFNSDFIPQIKQAINEAVIHNAHGDWADYAGGLNITVNLGGSVDDFYGADCGSNFTNWVDLFYGLF